MRVCAQQQYATAQNSSDIDNLPSYPPDVVFTEGKGSLRQYVLNLYEIQNFDKKVPAKAKYQ